MIQHELPMEQLMELLRTQLADGGSARLPVTGFSMLPLLCPGRDQVVLAELDRRPRPGDMILYRRDSGRYVLHRVIRQMGDGWLCCGDNQWRPEPVALRQMLAVVTGVVRRGRSRALEGPRYGLYVWLWVGLFPLRRGYIALRRALGWLKRRLR